MTWTYTPSATPPPKDEVRLYIGDTDATDPQLQDEEIAFILADEGNVLRAAVTAAETIAAKYARKVTFSHSKRSENWGDLSRAYRDLATRLRRKMARMGARFYAGGQSINEKIQRGEDTDRIGTFFTRDMEEEPGTEAPIDNSQQLPPPGYPF